MGSRRPFSLALRSCYEVRDNLEQIISGTNNEMSKLLNAKFEKTRLGYMWGEYKSNLPCKFSRGG